MVIETESYSTSSEYNYIAYFVLIQCLVGCEMKAQEMSLKFNKSAERPQRCTLRAFNLSPNVWKILTWRINLFGSRKKNLDYKATL